MAAFGGKGQETQREALQYLGLTVPNICWHSSRDRICELANLLTQVAASLGKIAREVYALQQAASTEVGWQEVCSEGVPRRQRENHPLR